MPTTQPSRHPRRLVALAACGVLVATAAWMVWHARGPDSPVIDSADEQSAAPAIDLNDPPESYDTFLHVRQTGGCRLTRAAAIGWLDVHTRQRRALPADQAHHLMDVLRTGGHEAWEAGYRQHLYNSAFNALHLCDIAEDLTHLLHDLARHDDDRVMRLYALQHIGMQRESGQLKNPLAGEIHATLQQIAASPESDVAGTAIHLLTEWDGRAADAPPSVLELAAHSAADRSRPVDVRVSAIHSAGAAALGTARAIAADTTEPVILRKAAIARIGHHGDQGDRATLKTLGAESARLAQAADPALESLQNRLRNPSAPAPIPYP